MMEVALLFVEVHLELTLSLIHMCLTEPYLHS